MVYVVSAPKIEQISEAADPKDGILKAVGDALDTIRVMGNRVLVGTYIQPSKMKSGLYLSADTLKEDEFQGVVGLILAVGPDAAGTAKQVDGPGIGDWVVYSTRDSWSQTVNGAPCRILNYDAIRMWIKDPKVIYAR